MMPYRLPVPIAAATAQFIQLTLQSYPPARPQTRAQHPRTPILLGTQLLTLGYLAPLQLSDALQEQRNRRQHVAAPKLGTLLVRDRILHPQVVTIVLLLQLLDRLFCADPLAPVLLGEQLVRAGTITTLQWALAIQAQLEQEQAGRACKLGDMLVAHGVLRRDALARALAEQQQQSIACITAL